MEEKKTAAYKITPDTDGNRYRFYCDVSGALVCITSPYHADTPEEELMLAWEKEGRQHFNQCRKCGRFIIDAVYNPSVFECTDCAPFEYETRYCKSCGAKIDAGAEERFCPVCKQKLHYEGSE